MTKSRLGAGLLLLATFILGGFFGGAVSTYAERRDFAKRHGHKERPTYVERLDQEVSLRPAQRDSVSAILDRHKPVMDSLWAIVGPQFDSERESIRREIRAVLSPEQLERYNAMTQRQDVRRAEQRERSRNEKR
jgi:hypothetical protein